MSYNVGAFKKYNDDLGHFSYPEVAKVIKSVDAKIVGLNETDHGAVRTLGEYQASKLATALGTGWSPSFPSDNPQKCIDYIFAFKNGHENELENDISVLDTGVITPDDVPEVATASDHCPVWAKLMFHI